MSLIAFDKVTCVRGGRCLFEEVSFSLGRGDALRVVGPNGAGKSSLLRIAAGLLRPAGGRVVRCQRIALVDERLAFDPDRALIDELRFWLRFDGRMDLAEDALAAFGLSPLAQAPVRLLSNGQRRRAALAAAWGDASQVWLLDEPLNGLDDAARAQALLEIRAFKSDGHAVIYASHEPLDLFEERVLELGR